MKGKKVKNIRKGIKLYASEFGFREPYQILIEGEFLNQSLKYRLNIKEKISKYFDGQVKLMITTCTIQDLRNLGEDYTGSVVAAKRLIRRRCPHQEAIKGIDCIKQTIGLENEFRYCIASLSPELNKHIQEIPGVPILTLSRDILILSPLSYASKEKINMLAKAKLMPSSDELKRLKLVTGIDLETKKTPVLPLHRRKIPKAPNPLSVKKKKNQPKGLAPKDKNKVEIPALKTVPETASDELATENIFSKEALSSISKNAKRKRRRSKKKAGPLTDESVVKLSRTEVGDVPASDSKKRRCKYSKSDTIVAESLETQVTAL